MQKPLQALVLTRNVVDENALHDDAANRVPAT